MTKHTIKYHSKSDGQIIEREFDPNAEDQREFVAKTGNLCRVYFDVEKTVTEQLPTIGLYRPPKRRP